MSLGLQSKRDLLLKRSALFKQTRDFFDAKQVLEVDPIAISPYAAIDTHIDLVKVIANNKQYYLHSSPELKMKRLLALDVGDIYFLGHVFRDKELGQEHQIEFTMLEWYRVNWHIRKLIDEVSEYLMLCLDQILSVEILSFEQTCLRYLGYIPEKNLDEIFAFHIQPYLGQNQLTVILGFPVAMAALAQIQVIDQKPQAARFEVFYQGKELANGYQECLDSHENRNRFIEQNNQRVALNKEPYPLDELFLDALKEPMRPCCGVSVGIDRLLMLKTKATHIDQVVPFAWEDM